MFEQLNKPFNEDPRLFTIIQGLLMRRVPFDNPWLADEESSIRNQYRRVQNQEKERRVQGMGGWDALPSRQARQATATDGGFLDCLRLPTMLLI